MHDATFAAQALHALSERDRSALLMSEEDLSYNEIAQLLSISAQSVGTTLSRARRRMAEQYQALIATSAIKRKADVNV